MNQEPARAAVHPRVSVSLISAVRWTVAQNISFLKASRIDAISVNMMQLEPHAGQSIDQINAAGLRTISIGTRGGSLIDSEAATFDVLRPAIDAAVALNCPAVFGVSGPAPSRMPTDQAFDRLAGTLGPANSYARSKGVRLGLENSSAATRDKGFIHTLADAVELSRACDVGIAVELQNCWYERHLPRLFRENFDRFMVIQCSDFVLGEDVRLNRRVPGDGSMPLEWMIGELLEAGYAGYFDLEMIGPAIEQEGYASAIGRGVAWLSERLSSWGA